MRLRSNLNQREWRADGGRSSLPPSGNLRRAVEWRRLSHNPVTSVPKPTAKRQRVVRPLLPVEIERLRRAAGERSIFGPRDATLISLLAYAGLRPRRHSQCIGEIFASERSSSRRRSMAREHRRRLRLVGFARCDFFRRWPETPMASDPNRTTQWMDSFSFLAPTDSLGETLLHAWHQAAWQPAIAAHRLGGCPPLRIAPQLRVTSDPGRPEHHRRRPPGRPLADDELRRIRPCVRRVRLQ